MILILNIPELFDYTFKDDFYQNHRLNYFFEIDFRETIAIISFIKIRFKRLLEKIFEKRSCNKILTFVKSP